MAHYALMHEPSLCPLGFVVFSGVSSELTDTTVEFERSFRCRVKEDVEFNRTDYILPHLHLKNLKVQAFEFKKNNTYGNGEVLI